MCLYLEIISCKIERKHKNKIVLLFSCSINDFPNPKKIETFSKKYKYFLKNRNG